MTLKVLASMLKPEYAVNICNYKTGEILLTMTAAEILNCELVDHIIVKDWNLSIDAIYIK